MADDLRVSFIVVVRNAERHIANLLSCYFSQDFPAERRELIIVDGCSTDRTTEVVADLIEQQSGVDCRILENPKKTLATGWNLALSVARYEVVVRVDAHATFGTDFIRRNMELISEGHMIVGGRRETLPEGERPGILFAAEVSRFGAGSSSFRNAGERRYVDTLGHAAYRREVYQAVGGYDERLSRNQDIEIHIRMRKAGFKFLFEPSIWSSHVARPTLRAFLEQKYRNGYWCSIILLLVGSYPYPRHFAPLALVLGIAFGAVLGFGFDVHWPIGLLLGTYATAAMAFSMSEIQKWRTKRLALLPFVFATLHLSYGLGSLAGLVGYPAFAIRNRGYVRQYPMR